MNTKKPIVNFFAERLPEYQFVGEKRPNLLFRWPQMNGIFRCIAIQRDGASNGLSVQVAATYDATWHGEPAILLGVDTGLANLKQKSKAIEAISHWEFYDPTLDGLHKTLEEIYRQFINLTPQFFTQAEHHLLSNRLLQLALAESKNISVEEKRELKQALEKAKFLLADLKHPAYLQLRDRLLTVESEMPEKERGWANGLACRCLLIEFV